MIETLDPFGVPAAVYSSINAASPDTARAMLGARAVAVQPERSDYGASTIARVDSVVRIGCARAATFSREQAGRSDTGRGASPVASRPIDTGRRMATAGTGLKPALGMPI
jgi:hypothetical protein